MAKDCEHVTDVSQAQRGHHIGSMRCLQRWQHSHTDAHFSTSAGTCSTRTRSTWATFIS